MAIDWKAAHETLLKLQKNIALAAIKKDRDEITKAKKRFVHFIEAKALAIRHVCDGNNLPSIDGVKWESDADKMRAELSLDSRGYKASPTRLLVIATKGQIKGRHV